ncbi:uncharacterized protein LOC130200648 [Pseudoliparis swirei]|uniref:uncharacterized protein LOC130200648 n=1 Tax=Pseudoliparis swirei TaxID=2059687 RepID=UPI0024BDDEF8|nr:uncharacterized protein LOC130200648 [Pseudoliparis swirei]
MDHSYALRDAGAGGDYVGAPGPPAAIRRDPTPTPNRPTPIPPTPPNHPTLMGPPQTGPQVSYQLWNVLKQLRPQPPRNQKRLPGGAGRGLARLPRQD